MTIWYSHLFFHFLNIFYIVVFVFFAGLSARRVRKGFNLLNKELLSDVNDVLLLNGLVAFLMIVNLLYILLEKVLSVLICVANEKPCLGKNRISKF
jgi:hypothetical protein